MDNTNNRLERATKEFDKTKLLVIYGNSLEPPIASLFDEGMLRFKLSDENIRQTITKNAFTVLNNVWKNLASGM
jgi:hypothetical protein